MASKLSIDIQMNSQGYVRGAQEASNSTKNLEKSTRDYLKEFGTLSKQMRDAKTEARNLAAQFTMLSKTERESEIGQNLAEELDLAIQKAAELQDVMGDVNDAIKNAASDTAGWDALKESFEIGKSAAMGFAGALAKVSGDAKSMQSIISTLAMIEGGFNTVIKVGNALQQKSAIMNALKKAGVISLTQAERLEAAATTASAVATRALGVAIKALPFVGLVAVAASVVQELIAYVFNVDKATSETTKFAKELTKQQQALQDASKAFTGDYASALAKTMANYDLLKSSYSKLKTEHEKQQWITDNKTKLNELGIEVKNVNDADKVLLDNSGKITKAFIARAKAAAAAAKLVKLYGAMIDATLDAEKKAVKFEAGQKISGSDKERYGLQEGKDYTQNKNKVGDYTLTESGAAKANAEAAKKNVQTNTQEIANEIDRTIALIEDKNSEYSQTLSELGLSETGGPGGSGKGDKNPVEESIKGMFPDTSKLDKQMKKNFDDFVKKTNESAQAATDKLKKDLNVDYVLNNVLNTHIDVQQAQNEINKALGVLADGSKFEIDWDFSALPDKLEDAANEGVKNLDRIAEAMAKAGKARDKFASEGNSKGVEEMNNQLDDLSEKYDKQLEQLNDYQKRANQIENLSEAFSLVGNQVGSLGSLFSALGEATDDAGMKAIGIIAETLATMALSFAKALNSCTTWWEWLAFGITGMVQLISMVSQIKNLTAEGHAGGGIVGGNSFTGDKILAGLNSGEMVMNGNQQKHLWDIISGMSPAPTPNDRIQVEGVIRGKDILIVQKNYNTIAKRSGQNIKIN